MSHFHACSFFNEMFDLLILTYSRPQKYVVKVKVKWRLSEGNVSSFSNLFNLYVYLKTEKLEILIKMVMHAVSPLLQTTKSKEAEGWED